MTTLLLFWCVLASCAARIYSEELQVDSGVSIKEANRLIDITSQLAKYVTEFTVENDGPREISQFFYALSKKEDSHLAFIGATAGSSTSHLVVSRMNAQSVHDPTAVIFKIELLSPIGIGRTDTVKVEVVLAQYLTPHPSHVTQAEQQFVVYEGNAHILSAHKIEKETTTVLLYPGKVESYTKTEKSKHENDKVIYGPYKDTQPFTTVDIRVHYENNSPFLVVTKMERVIEVSHWGNVAVEEHIWALNKGALLKGSFSRLDFQMDRRGQKQPVVKSYKTLLPSSARDVYYRDEIGNISTSNLRQTDDAVELEIRPRFPLFGGWKTDYVLGYNVPSYEYLFSSGNQFGLRMRFVDHIFDNMLVEEMTVKVILPEGSKNIKLNPPYKVKRSADELHFTYLDTVGRTTVIAHKTNLVEAHVQEFTLYYTFDRTGLWREPFIAVIAFYVLFLAVIIYVRFDFTIAEDAASESRLKVQSLVESLTDLHTQRISQYDQYVDIVNKFKQSKDQGALQSSKKKLDSEMKTVNNTIGDLQTDMKTASPDVADKIGEMQRLDKTAKELLAGIQMQTERLVSGKVQKGQYGETEKSFKQKMDDVKDKMDALVYGL